ncbi:family 43 glycosylhydrolase [Pontibacter rugosus]|uniref:Family 43 glycosylhydrolase n=1 Tax=Pontibacter rugosus TaxID=1745966 RepID=A0ABW3SKX9_9BACT
MKNYNRLLLLVVIPLFLTLGNALAQNPIIQNQFTADPTARVFKDRVYVYPSHDILPNQGKGKPDWFVMEDYHVFSSADLKEWTDHGEIVNQKSVPWADPEGYSMWAPDCVERNGKYYFYFPTKAQDTTYNGQGFSIGVAVADQPEGPFKPQAKPIANVKGIDPNVLIDKDGQAYLYWSQGHIYGAKLKDNMLELASEPKVLKDLPDKGLKEGPFVFERNGIYYMTYPHVENKTERLEYAVGNNPLGPFTFNGVIMDESPTGCWTNHQSILSFKNQWYLFYHHNDLSPNFDKNRSVRIDSLFFEQDGAIRKVTPTLRGVGVTQASDKIQLDRYSQISEHVGASIAFLDTRDTFKGWKVVLDKPNAWVRFNAVDFGKGKAKSVTFRAVAPEGGTAQLRLGGKDGPILSTVEISKGKEWSTYTAPVVKAPEGLQDLVLVLQGGQKVEVDWVEFKEQK